MSESTLNSEVSDDLGGKSHCSHWSEASQAGICFVKVNTAFAISALRQKSHSSLELLVRLLQPSQCWDGVHRPTEPKLSLNG